MQLLVGPRDGDHLFVEVVGRVHPAATDFWDGNWLTARISARAGAFRGAFVADLRADELQRFAEQLRALEGAPAGKAALESAEGWVTLALALDARGRLVGSCELRDDPAGGAALRFGLAADPAQRLELLAALGALLEAFPVVGDPEAEGSTLLGAFGEEDDGVPDDA